MPPTRTRGEIGAVGLPLFSGFLSLDPNVKLRGLEAIRAYRQMAFDEPAAASFLAAALNLLHTDLYVAAGGPTRNDNKAAQYVEECLLDMRNEVATYVRQMYSCLWAGFDIHELCYKRRGGRGSRYSDGRVGWSHWGLRRQESMYRWETKGANGDVVGFMQKPAPSYTLRTLPLVKCVHIVADDGEGSPEGKSALRGMYRQWVFVKNLELLEGIALERFGTGIPVFEIDEAVVTRLTPDDMALIEEAGKALRQNEEAYIILPAGVSFRFAPSPGLTSEDYRETIRYKRAVMLSTALADFIALGTGTDGGAYALGKDKSELFLLALNGYQDRITGALNRQAIPRLLAANGPNAFGKLTDMPQLALPAVKRYDLEQIGKYLGALKAAGAFHPTPEDEAHLRRIGELTEIDDATLRLLHEMNGDDEEEEEAAQQGTADADDEGGEEEGAEADEETEEEEEEVMAWQNGTQNGLTLPL